MTHADAINRQFLRVMTLAMILLRLLYAYVRSYGVIYR